nr:MAG: hypothetical protein DIU78_06135 [Pseudomonadota bacterium]
MVAGLGAPLWLLLTAPRLGYEGGSALYALGLLVVYPPFVSPDRRRGVVAAVLAALLAAPVALLRPDALVVLAVVPLVLGVVRGAVLFPRPLARTLAYEMVFAFASLLVVAILYEPGLFGVTLSAWGFWLVQAGHALVPGDRAVNESETDPFERAHAAALAILDRRSV